MYIQVRYLKVHYVHYVPIYLTYPTLPYRLPYRLPYCTLSIVGIESSYRKAYYIQPPELA